MISISCKVHYIHTLQGMRVIKVTETVFYIYCVFVLFCFAFFRKEQKTKQKKREVVYDDFFYKDGGIS